MGMWFEMSLKNILKRVGERQLPCATPVLIVKEDDVDDFQVTWKVLSRRKLLTYSRREAGRLALASL